MSKEDYVLTGASSPLFSQSTTLTGDITIGASGVFTLRVKMKDIRIYGNLTFFNDAVNQGLKNTFYNCEFNCPFSL